MSTCPYILAQLIESMTAKRVLAEAAGRKGAPRGLTAEQFYDPHAAYLLGELIEKHMQPQK